MHFKPRKSPTTFKIRSQDITGTSMVSIQYSYPTTCIPTWALQNKVHAIVILSISQLSLYSVAVILVYFLASVKPSVVLILCFDQYETYKRETEIKYIQPVPQFQGMSSMDLSTGLQYLTACTTNSHGTIGLELQFKVIKQLYLKI